MKHMKKLWALVLALVMALALGVTALATESVGVPGGNPFGPGNEPVVQFTIEKQVVKDEKAATPPAETFEFVLEDTANEKKPLDYYGIELLDELKIETDGANTYGKTIRAKINMSKVNPNGGWKVIPSVGSQDPSSYTKTFHITEKIDGKEDWTNTSNDRYDVTFRYDCTNGDMTCTVYGRGTDSSAEFAQFTNTYTKQADPTTTVEIPFTKVVKLGGNANADSQAFELEIFNIGNSNTSDYANVKYTAKVETNGAKTYTGEIVITGPKSEVNAFISGGFYVREKNTKADNWTYSNAMWYVQPVGTNNGIAFTVYPATKQTTDNGDSYEYDRMNPVTQMTFTNIYTRHVSHTRTETKIESPKTFDAGIGLYAVSALLSVTGSAWLVGKKHK